MVESSSSWSHLLKKEEGTEGVMVEDGVAEVVTGEQLGPATVESSCSGLGIHKSWEVEEVLGRGMAKNWASVC